jgi:hypothetical protein
MVTKKSRQMANEIMAGVAEIQAMLRDGANPEERFTVRTAGIPGPSQGSPGARADRSRPSCEGSRKRSAARRG